MTYEVQFTRQAETDLDAIYQYYRLQFSEASARKVLKTLKEAISRLHQFPEAFINFLPFVNQFFKNRAIYLAE